MTQREAICPKCQGTATVTESTDERMAGTVVTFETRCPECGHEERTAILR